MQAKSKIKGHLINILRELFGQKNGKFNKFIPYAIEWRLKNLVRNWLIYSGNNNYQDWIKEYLKERSNKYKTSIEPNLFSFLTTVWDTPLEYLEILAKSLIDQKGSDCCEWIILDNGSSKLAVINYLKSLERYSWIKLYRVEENLGIINGIRLCLEKATGLYVIPLDSDDYLYPDCLKILAWYVKHNKYPAILYTDEDKLLENKPTEPYFKPDWDPVLFINSAYIAHLGIINRQLALELGVYEDANATGSHDWDTFTRFMLAGYTPIHIPEVVYSWRIHSQSTSGNIKSKSYIHSSQQTVLNRFLSNQKNSHLYYLDYSPLFNQTPDWWIRRKEENARPLISIIFTSNLSVDDDTIFQHSKLPTEHQIKRLPLNAGLDDLFAIVKEGVENQSLIQLVSETIVIQEPEWYWEVMTLLELYPDTVMVGGRIYNSQKVITDAGQYLGFAGECSCPDLDRTISDPGYFAQMWKQRSVSAVSSQFSVVDAKFLFELLSNACHAKASIQYLGVWAGAYALRQNQRIIYSPFLSGLSDEPWQKLVKEEEKEIFVKINQDLIPDNRFLSSFLSLDKDTPYQIRK
jgi:glycosyltransferase involved in cell wall biosynthesis